MVGSEQDCDTANFARVDAPPERGLSGSLAEDFVKMLDARSCACLDGPSGNGVHANVLRTKFIGEVADRGFAERQSGIEAKLSFGCSINQPDPKRYSSSITDRERDTACRFNGQGATPHDLAGKNTKNGEYVTYHTKS